MAAAKRRWTSDTFEQSDNDTNEEDLMNFSNLSAHELEEFLLKDKINIDDIVLIYLSLTYFGVSWRKADLFLRQIGSLGASTCHKWSEIFISGDPDEFLEDGTDGQREQEFFGVFPELENMAKLYAFEGCQRKSASLTSLELALYVDKQYYDFTG
ncbi:unnamed protein product [Rotaria magnacalcarata]|uniref:Uncharacterized protein n=1 Tax=Rotaria magnacalcarata TaxID=392030 RepID=A0A820G650_9BILA|nr:unnamed protein product [Rotaria magnacalcarata]